MKHSIYFILICFLMSCGSKEKETTKKQAKETQTVVSVDTSSIVANTFDKLNVIAPKGSQLLSESVKIRNLGFDGYTLQKVEVSECEESGDGTQDPNDDKKIKSISFKDNTFTVEFTVVENCCSAFLCEAELVSKSTLNIIYHAYGRHCTCYCKFMLKYTFEKNDFLENLGEKKIPITHVQFNSVRSSRKRFKKF